ncbi:MAG: hypothetical protein QG615_1064 [Nitrospirota bacterium]|nr:hypothetical protein [Nitrospirota bacterium]
MAEIYLKRTLTGFVADDEAAASSMRRIPVGTTVRCEIVKPRSVAQLRMYWAMCSLVAMNHAELQTREQVDQALRLLTGHVDLVKVGDKVLQLPRRIAFSTLSQDEWTDYLSRAKDAVCEHLLPGVDGDEIQNEILRLAA